MRILGPLAAATGLVACFSASPSIQTPARSEQSQVAALRVSSDRPLRVDVPISQSIAAVVRSLRRSTTDRLPTVRLTLEGVQAEAESSGLRVFVGVLKGELSIDSPNFVGSVAFGHSGPFESTPTDSFLLNIAPALSRLQANARLVSGQAGDRLPVTLALRPTEGGVAAPAIHVKRLGVSLPEAGTPR